MYICRDAICALGYKYTKDPDIRSTEQCTQGRTARAYLDGCHFVTMRFRYVCMCIGVREFYRLICRYGIRIYSSVVLLVLIFYIRYFVLALLPPAVFVFVLFFSSHFSHPA